MTFKWGMKKKPAAPRSVGGLVAYNSCAERDLFKLDLYHLTKLSERLTARAGKRVPWVGGRRG